MMLNLQHKQMSLIIRLLNLNQPSNPSGGISTTTGAAGTEEVYKILIMDTICCGILSPLIHVNELRKHGITLFFAIDKNRQTIPDVPAIYFVHATPENIEHITADAARGLYKSFHLNFSSSLPRPLLETLASKTLEKDAVHRTPRSTTSTSSSSPWRTPSSRWPSLRPTSRSTIPPPGIVRPRRSWRRSSVAYSVSSPPSGLCR